jgi:hypothetical protein
MADTLDHPKTEIASREWTIDPGRDLPDFSRLENEHWVWWNVHWQDSGTQAVRFSTSFDEEELERQFHERFPDEPTEGKPLRQDTEYAIDPETVMDRYIDEDHPAHG